MALISSAWTTATTEAYTRANVLRRLLRDGGLGEYGTATGGSTSTVVDTGTLQSSGYPDDKYKGMWARIEYDAGGAAAAPELEIRPVTSSTASSGTVTVNPVYSASPASGDRYQLWAFMHPQKVLDTLDQVMTQDAFLPDWGICTEVPDGDMEQNNITNWTDSGNASTSKSTSEPMMSGKRYLTIDGQAGDYAESALLRVVPGRRYHVSALARDTNGGATAKLIAYDKTNSATISSVTTASRTTVRIWMEITVPSTCYAMAIRLQSVAADQTDWDDVCVYALDSQDLPLPWWVSNKSQVKGVFKSRWTDIGDNQWDPIPWGDLDRDRWDFRDSAFGRGQLRIVSRQGPPSEPVYIFGLRNETAWANENTETKHIDLDWVTARMMVVLLRQMKGPLSIGLQHSDWLDGQQKYWEEEWRKERKKQEERIQDVLQAQAPEVYVYPNGYLNSEARLTVN